MAAAHEVPLVYDLVISDGTTTQGYVLYEPYDGGSPNVPEKAVHAFSSAFVPRTNVEGNYGDDKQEFFLTFSQKDWGLGEQQRYARASDSTSRRYWIGANVNVTKPGQVTLRGNVDSLALAANMSVCANGQDSELFFATATNLYSIPSDGAIDDHGAHGLGIAPEIHGLVCDNADVYITGEAGGNGVRKFSIAGGTFSTFSATGAASLAFLNNSLYGYVLASSDLVRYASNGTATVLHTWRDADGADAGDGGRLCTFGGKLLILLYGDYPNSVYIYDGVGVSKLFDLPTNFFAWDIKVAFGIIYVSGRFIRGHSTDLRETQNAVYYYSSGQTGLLWRAENYVANTVSVAPGIAEFDGGLLIADAPSDALLYYNPITGGVSTIGTLGDHTSSTQIATSQFYAFIGSIQDDANLYPERSVLSSTGSVTSSLIDFDSSLDKFFRGIKVDYDEGSGGDGGSVDIAYRLNDLDGAYTSLATGITSGQEYTLGAVGSSVKGRSISVKVTLNKGTSTTGPVLKRLYVRAAPIINSFHQAAINLDCTGKDGNSPIRLRNQALEPKNGLALAHTLKEFAEGEKLLSITDKFGTRVSTIERCEFTEIRSDEFVARVVFREV